jgi:hypothetical protein
MRRLPTLEMMWDEISRILAGWHIGNDRAAAEFRNRTVSELGHSRPREASSDIYMAMPSVAKCPAISLIDIQGV